MRSKKRKNGISSSPEPVGYQQISESIETSTSNSDGVQISSATSAIVPPTYSAASNGLCSDHETQRLKDFVNDEIKRVGLYNFLIELADSRRTHPLRYLNCKKDGMKDLWDMALVSLVTREEGFHQNFKFKLHQLSGVGASINKSICHPLDFLIGYALWSMNLRADSFVKKCGTAINNFKAGKIAEGITILEEAIPYYVIDASFENAVKELQQRFKSGELQTIIASETFTFSDLEREQKEEVGAPAVPQDGFRLADLCRIYQTILLHKNTCAQAQYSLLTAGAWYGNFWCATVSQGLLEGELLNLLTKDLEPDLIHERSIAICANMHKNADQAIKHHGSMGCLLRHRVYYRQVELYDRLAILSKEHRAKLSTSYRASPLFANPKHIPPETFEYTARSFHWDAIKTLILAEESLPYCASITYNALHGHDICDLKILLGTCRSFTEQYEFHRTKICPRDEGWVFNTQISKMRENTRIKVRQCYEPVHQAVSNTAEDEKKAEPDGPSLTS